MWLWQRSPGGRSPGITKAGMSRWLRAAWLTRAQTYVLDGEILLHRDLNQVRAENVI
jgi:hypothetical protein